MRKINSMILTTIFSVLILSMVISPTYPTLIPAYAAPAETPTLDAKCQAEGNSNKPVTADCQLLNLLKEEIAERIAADIVLQENIDDEEALRIAADLLLQGNIDDEAAARIAADLVLQGNIDDEEAARITDDNKIKDKGNDTIEAALLALDAMSALLLIGVVGCTADFSPGCMVTFGAMEVLVQLTIVVLEAIAF